MSTATNTRKANHTWLWALLPLLLAAALAIPLLDVDAFNGDEPASLSGRGVLRSGPWSLEEISSAIADIPEQAGLACAARHLGASRRLE